jgi:hypothetical protein
MAKRKRRKKSAEDLGTENELMKLKMMAEFGGDFVGNEGIPPDVENQFLKQIISFHKKHDNAPLTNVYKYVGEPEYNHVNDMGDAEVSKELKQLIKLMDKKGVTLTVLAPTPDREIYRFITEELFKHEIEDVKMKGWVNQFIYEEFHPNPEYDINNTLFYVLQAIFNKNKPFFEEYFSEEMIDHLGLSTDTDDLRERIEYFWSQFNNVKLEQYDLTKLDVNKETGIAHAVCQVAYKTQKEKGRRYKREQTTIVLQLIRSKYMDNWWEVKQVTGNILSK